MSKILLVVLSLLLSFLVFQGDIDTTGKEHIERSFDKAAIVFATAKGLNAVISIAQGTEVGPPGVTFTLGEVLDPVNDLIEQFSWVILASLTSLGIQKITLGIISWDIFNLAVVFFIALFVFLTLMSKKVDKKYILLSFKIAFLMVFLRFSVPVMAITNDAVYNKFISNSEYNIVKNTEDLSLSASKIDNINKKDKKDNSSWLERFSGNFDIDKRIQEYKNSAKKISDYVINLIIVYLFQTIFFPIIFLILLYALIKNTLNLGRN